VDENPPFDVVMIALDRGHEATWVRKVLPGAPDGEVFARLGTRGETLVTRDVRFANFVAALLFHRISARVRGYPVTERGEARPRWLARKRRTGYRHLPVTRHAKVL
jgi:hypothetical protein